MCGINGFNFVDAVLVQKMNKKTRHRGPDDEGFFLSEKWSLGHNRLSILDTSNLGHQPMQSKDGRYTIVYNGEVFNFAQIKEELIEGGYKFVSGTDTEVVLSAYEKWGSACLEKFNGMFALAILDNKDHSVFLARDRAGIKPLYYYAENGSFIFSSEIKALLEHPLKRLINRDALNIYFRLLYVPAPLTMFQNIYKLKPGSYALVKDGEVTTASYWEPGGIENSNDKRGIEKDIHEILVDSVKMQLTSDRPVGIFLSGGVDSTIIAGIASSFSKRIKTFSVGFTETQEAEKYNFDLNTARKTAEYFKTNHKEYIFSMKEIVGAIKKAIYFMDEPVSNPTQIVNLLLAREASKHVKVVLGGDGGDELFGGYERYYYNFYIDLFQKIPVFLRQNIFFEFFFKIIKKESLFDKLNTPPGVDRFLNFHSQPEDVIESFLKPSYNDSTITNKWVRELYFKNIDKENFTRQFARVDFLSWFTDESLVRSDKMSMASGLEQRVPFLDNRLISLADSIPFKYKIGRKHFGFLKTRGYQGKKILKSAMSAYIPSFVLSQPKSGWFSPASKWIRGDLSDIFNEVLSPSYCEGTNQIFDFKEIKRILEEHKKGERYALNTLWSIFTFQIWYKMYIDQSEQIPE